MTENTHPTIGLITDPDSPTVIGSSITDGLAEWLMERTSEVWNVEVVSDPGAASDSGIRDVMDRAATTREVRGWRHAICVTDLPLLLDDRPAVAEWDRRQGVAVISMPALGGLVRWQMKRVSTHLLAELLDDREVKEEAPEMPLTESTKGSARDQSARYSMRPLFAWPALVMGMVRVNRPWGLILGLSGALAAALATSAFGLSSTTIWQIGDQLSTPHRIIAGLLAATVLVTWLILSHRLWERRKDREPGFQRLAMLYNAATLATLLIGVLMLYLTLFTLNLGVAWYLVPEGLLEETLGHQAGLSTYLGMAWGFSTMGVLAGAVGASLDSDESVRQVAYGHREAHRLSTVRDTA